jgi:hypothetical protein
MKHKKVRTLLLSIARNPSDGRAGIYLKLAVNAATSDLSRDVETGDWVIKNLYSILVSHMKDKDRRRYQVVGCIEYWKYC